MMHPRKFDILRNYNKVRNNVLFTEKEGSAITSVVATDFSAFSLEDAAM